MKLFIILMSVVISGCATLENATYHPTAPGYLAVETSMRDKVKHVSINPAYLFDSDDSMSLFKLGFYWQPAMGEDVHFLVSVPSKWDADVNVVAKNARDLIIIQGDKEIKLKKKSNSVKVKHTRAFGKKVFYLEYRFSGKKKLLTSMLNEKNVRVRLIGPDKTYEGRFDVNNQYRLKYKDNKNYAFNAANRFVEAMQKQE